MLVYVLSTFAQLFAALWPTRSDLRTALVRVHARSDPTLSRHRSHHQVAEKGVIAASGSPAGMGHTPQIYNSWLPQPVAQRLAEEEPRAFAAAVKRLHQAVGAARAAGPLQAPGQGPTADELWPKALPWVDEIKALISTKSDYCHQDVLSLVHTLWEVVLTTGDDVEVQVRMGELLSHVLRHYRHDKQLRSDLVLPWRPLYDLLDQLLSDPLPQLQGAILMQARHTTLFTIVARARRFFAPSAAAEMWDTFRPPLLGDPNSSSAAVALGWLVMFFPTKALPLLEPGLVQGWVDEWVDIWGRLVHCPFWDSHWMYLVARCIKDDWKGVVRWERHLPQLYTHLLWAFSVPVGTATASVPTSQGAPQRANLLFGSKVDQVDDCSKSAAKIAVHLLKQRDPQQPQEQQQPGTPVAAAGPGTPKKARVGLTRMQSLGLGASAEGSGVDLNGILRTSAAGELPQVSEAPASSAVLAACDSLDSLVQLLEQYAHPSNGGQWSGDIAVFLTFSVHYFMKQLGRQCGLRGWRGEQRVVPEAARRFVRAALKLAARGQFSKSGSLASVCCKALCHLSYVWPEEVLPLVVSRFQSALETTTAMHQLPTSITTLAMCVRPLLLSGWHTQEESTQQVIAEAMMAVLPGIDANDESKTAAVFQFYTAVLASIPQLRGAADEDDADPAGGSADVLMGGGGGQPGAAGVYRLPLYLEDWVEQVMERLLSLLSNLDTGAGHKGTDTQAKSDLLLRSSGIGKDTMYANFFNHLLLRLPHHLALRVLQQLSQLACGSPLPSVAWEASSMFKTAGMMLPAETEELVLQPLIKKLTAEVPEEGVTSVSRSLEDLLTWRLVLLGTGVGVLPGDSVVRLLPQLQVIIDACYKVPSRVAFIWTSQLLSCALSSLTSWHCPAAWASEAARPSLPNGLQLFVDRQGTGWAPPAWSSPGPQHVAAAEQLVDKYLEQAGQELVAVATATGSGSKAAGGDATAGSTTAAAQLGEQQTKYKLLSLVNRMVAVASGLMSRLRDFDGLPGADVGLDGTPLVPGAGQVQSLRVVGWLGPTIGRPGVRNRAAAAFATAIKQLRSGDREVLELALSMSMVLLANGVLEQMVASQMHRPGQSSGDVAVLEEPAAATAYLLASGCSLGQTLGFGAGSVQEQQEAEEEEVAGRWGEEWRWRKRSSIVSAMNRVRRMLVWRSGLAASRVQLAAGEVEVDAARQLPREYLDLLWEVVQMTMVPYKSIRSVSLTALQSVIKRFPNLARLVLPHALAAIAGTKAPLQHLAPDPSSTSSTSSSQQVQQFLDDTLRQLMLSQPGDSGSAGAAGGSGGAAAATTAAAATGIAAAAAATGIAAAAAAVAAAAAAATATPAGAATRPALPPRGAAAATAAAALSAAQESENDGRVAGAAAILNSSIECWRALFHDPALFSGVMRALMASRTHTSTACQNSVSNLLMQMVARFKYPRGMAFDSPSFQQLQADFLTLAEPGHLRGSWRYSVLANVFTMFLAPPPDAPQVLPVTKHCLGLLKSDVILLRGIGAAGLYLQLSWLVDHGRQNPGIVSELQQWLSSSPDLGEQLVRRMVLSHAKLDAAAEGARGAAGGRSITLRLGNSGNLGSLASMMNMTFEELVGTMVGSAVEKFDRWPPDGERPPALHDGTFEVAHARLVRLVASLCPQQLLGLMQSPLTSRMAQYAQPTGPQEKAEQAAVAEVVAGLLAGSAAPPSSRRSSSSGGGAGSAAADTSGDWLWSMVRSALAATTLDMAESWAVALRYGLHYLLKAVGSTGASSSEAGGLASPAAATTAQGMLEEVISCILASPGGRSSNALPSELKRLKYILQGLDAVRQYCSNSTAPMQAPNPRPSSEGAGAAPPAQGLLAYGWGSKPPKMVRTFLAGVMQELNALLASEQPSAVRESLGALLSEVLVLFAPSLRLDALAPQLQLQRPLHRGSSGSGSSPGSSVVVVDPASAIEAELQQGLAAMEVDQVPSGMSTPVEIDLGPSGAAEEGKSEEGTVLVVHCSMHSLQAQAQKLATQVVCSFLASSQQLQGLKGTGTRVPSDDPEQTAAGGSSAEGAPDAPMADTAEGSSRGGAGSEGGQRGRSPPIELPAEDIPAAAARAGVGLQLVTAACLDGDAGMLRPLLLVMLRPVLLLQELAGPSLQQLSSEAKSAFVMSKYVPYLSHQLAAVVGSIVKAGASHYWSSRAAALVYLQLFWFRHCFLLTPKETAALQQLVLQGLQDPQAEVRHLAGATLSGLIKGLPATEASAVRERLLQQALALFGAGPGSGKRRRGAEGSASSSSGGKASLAEAQACIQGLKALVMSSPYDCPSWMPEVLMALVAAASSRQPLVRRDASRALSEFKRTHEQDALEELKGRLGEEQWEGLQQVTSSASYFV